MQNNPIYSDTNDTDNINLSKRAEISSTTLKGKGDQKEKSYQSSLYWIKNDSTEDYTHRIFPFVQPDIR